MSGPRVPPFYQALIDSPRVSTRTRQVLRAREAADDPAYCPVTMTPAQFTVLRAVTRRILPQPKGGCIDLAARLDAQLAQGCGDGWRLAILPDDCTSYARGLSVLDDRARSGHGQGFADLAHELQDEILALAAAGDLPGQAPALLNGAQMQGWFADLCVAATKLYVAHPATLARLGYSGIAYGGDGEGKAGFSLVGLGERETWEPISQTAPQPASTSQ